MKLFPNAEKRNKAIILNTAIGAVCIMAFSDAFLGLSFLSLFGLTVIGLSTAVFIVGNSVLMRVKSVAGYITKAQSLEDCAVAFKEANCGGIYNAKCLDQIKRFNKKYGAIKNMLLQKFDETEMSYSKFNGVMSEVKKVMFLSMKSVLNKIIALDSTGYDGSESGEEARIYSEYINFIENAVLENEKIILRMDRMLLEVSNYNVLESQKVENLPSVVEMDELIKTVNLYR